MARTYLESLTKEEFFDKPVMSFATSLARPAYSLKVIEILTNAWFCSFFHTLLLENHTHCYNANSHSNFHH